MAGSKGSLKVRVDMKKNRLYCTIAGSISKTDMERFYTDVRFGVADLQAGFDVVTDLTNCHFGHLAAIPALRKVMHYLTANGVREVVRVINKKHMIYTQAVNLAALVQGYRPVYVNTLEEAEAFLEGANGRHGLRFNLLKKELRFGAGDLSELGRLTNISISGCAIETDAPLPVEGERLQISASLTGPKSVKIDFLFAATVVRLFDGGFAATFDDISAEDQERLQECLVQESRWDV